MNQPVREGQGGEDISKTMFLHKEDNGSGPAKAFVMPQERNIVVHGQERSFVSSDERPGGCGFMSKPKE